MTPFDLLTYSLITWYISYVVTSSYGPFHVFEKLRSKLPLGGLTSCIICLSVWVALVICLIVGINLLECFAIAGGALLLHGFTGWRVNY